tara:strand:+ start:14695 stop:18240 length:3546 start_codon:yes stop_codon:yes gene_type:complete
MDNMIEKDYQFWNNLIGWTLFSIALLTFGVTVEPTASYWDCAEYIATSAKLQVGHPPGAPFFQMMGAFFASFASSPEKIAVMVNYMSVFSSAFTILFLFWTLTLILRKIPSFSGLESLSQKINFFGSAALGALAFCFSDSFWFNAVEAEVYAMAMFFLAFLFWTGLRWENEMNTPRGDRWLLLMAFVIGLCFGVHFMALLTIPSLGMLYYFKNANKITFKGFIVANLLSVAVLLFIFKMLLPLTLAFFGNAEVFFVNTFGLPFNSGTLIAAVVFISFFYFSLRYTTKKNWVNINTGILCVLFVLLGFSSWIMIPIRANANTVINENSPSDARLLLAYYNLEQYPDTHLFYGPMFSDVYAGQDPDIPFIDDKPKYERDLSTGKYIIVNYWEDARYNTHQDHKGFLPRLHNAEYAANYMNFAGPLSFSIDPAYRSISQLQEKVSQFRQEAAEGLLTGANYDEFFKTYSNYLIIEKPSFWSNLRFMFEFQMGYMYWRYLMWNFTGRQNDKQGNYDVLDGNWISGIPFIDNMRLGNQNEIDEDAKNNKARNTYFFLPFLLGLSGLYFLYKQDQKRFWVLLLLFLFTGLALKVYLNERPFEPRERDYALVGSFYVFALWIGMGARALVHKIQQTKLPSLFQSFALGLCFLAVPLLMAYQNWDDHDRSERFTAQSIARSYLQSIQKDSGAMIFSIGDNDTFALWYAQEIEGFRTDVRTLNTSLLATDWYIDQMKRKTYESEPIPSQLKHPLYAYGVRDYIRYQPLADSLRWDIKDFVNWVASDHPRTKIKNLLISSGEDPNQLPKSQQESVFYPTNKIRVPVNKKNVLESGLVSAKDADKIVPFIDIELPESGITKNQLMMLDILANNDWKRPLYFTGGSYAESEYIWMKNYLQLEGLVYKLVPIRTELGKNNPYLMGRIDSENMYNIVTKWEWGNAESPDIYHDPETRKNSISFRSNLARLAEKLINENKFDKAEKIIDLALEKMPIDYFGYYSLLVPFLDGYYRIGKEEKAQSLFKDLSRKYKSKMQYFKSLEMSSQYELGEEILTEIEKYRTLVEAVHANEDRAILETAIDDFLTTTNPFIDFYGELRYYTLLIELAEGYYMAEAVNKAEAFVMKVNREIKKQLQYFSRVSPENQKKYIKAIQDVFLDYRFLLSIVVERSPQALKDTIQKDYEKTKALFAVEIE